MAVTPRHEQWMDIVGYDGLYQVSSLGRVRSTDRIVHYANGRSAHYRERIMKQKTNYRGYCLVGLNKNNKQRYYSVHRLVAAAFIPNPHGYAEVNHVDEDKLNNCAGNLEWCTAKYNCNYGTRTTRVAESLRQSTNHCASLKKPVIAVSKGGREIEFDSLKSAAAELGLHASNISSVISGRQKTSGGYTFKFSEKEIA